MKNTEKWPNFIVVGVEKAGSTSIWNNLMNTDDVFMVKNKAPGFFHGEKYGKTCNEKEYLNLFEDASNEMAIGEATASYFIDEETPELIYKKIPHRYYITPCLNYFMSKPFTYLKKRNQFAVKVVDYINKIKGYNQKPVYKIDIPEKFLNEAKRLIPNNKYIGFSITTANPYRIKSFNINEIIKVANFYAERFTPTFFIEKKYQELITQLKENVKNCYIPEEKSSNEFRRPMLVTALGSLTKFNLSINNGISHMLSFSQNKNFLFFNEQSEKWKPENGNTYIYDCKDKNTTIDKLSSEKIIEFLESN